jgi:hypothetical protein
VDTWVWIVIVAAVVVVIGIVVWLALKARRTQMLKEGFGSEYDRTVEHTGGRRGAERELLERQKRHEELDIRPLSAEARDRYAEQWETLQSRFVDDPSGAVRDADALVQRVMAERGYPVEDFDQRAADISVDHPDLIEKYRTADGIARANDRGEASTEDLRHSVRHYRALFEELLVVEREPAEARR